MNQCKSCGSTLGPKNKSGYCRTHYSQFGLRDDHGDRIRAGIKRRMAVDPEFIDALRRRARAVGKLPVSIEARRRSAISRRIWEQGAAHTTLASRKLAGERARATKLAWCPAELRDEYMRLIRSKRMLAVEARALILGQHEKDMLAFRRKCLAA